MSTPNECVCPQCMAACEYKPGLFKPGEAEAAAQYFGIPFEVFKKNLIIDWCDTNLDTHEDIPTTYYYAPKIAGHHGFEQERASFADGFATGKCIFLKEGRCSIHPVKPYECRVTMCCQNKTNSHKNAAVLAWLEAGNPLKEE